jgi:glutathione S-transferase
MIELYDLVGANNLRFSPFCWRTKAVMAYKKIPYTTVPIRFSDKAKLAFSGQDRVPVIKDNGKVISDSWTIAEYLEGAYPDAKIFPGLGLKEACRFFNLYVDRTVHTAVFPVVVTDIFQCVDPIDRDYFRKSREERLGMKLETAAVKRPEFRARMRGVMGDLNLAIAGQEYFFGTMTYADLCLFGSFKWIASVSMEPLLEATPALKDWWLRMGQQLAI